MEGNNKAGGDAVATHWRRGWRGLKPFKGYMPACKPSPRAGPAVHLMAAADAGAESPAQPGLVIRMGLEEEGKVYLSAQRRRHNSTEHGFWQSEQLAGGPGGLARAAQRASSRGPHPVDESDRAALRAEGSGGMPCEHLNLGPTPSIPSCPSCVERPLWRDGAGLAGSRGVADPRSTTVRHDQRPRAKSATRDPRPRATLARDPEQPVLDAHSDDTVMSPLQVLFCRCLAEFTCSTLLIVSTTALYCRMQPLHHVRVKIRIDTGKDSAGEFQLSWHNVPLAPDTSDKKSSAPCAEAQNDQAENPLTCEN